MSAAHTIRTSHRTMTGPRANSAREICNRASATKAGTNTASPHTSVSAGRFHAGASVSQKNAMIHHTHAALKRMIRCGESSVQRQLKARISATPSA